MFLSTKSKSIKRFSLVVGFVAAAYGMSYHKPTFFSGPSPRWDILLESLADLAAWAVSYFVSAWVAVRIIAWVLAGFSDNSK